MNIGIYARKSIYSDKSDSVDAQINLCKEYADSHYSDGSIYIYCDEGYTGANTQRPGFTNLMEDIKNKKINVLICYKIDRLSRNVLDFSKTFNELQFNKVEFVSVKEQIDTSTPLGRAMMYICSVFAQMERETIAERVKDNMIELAKSGKWPGGQPPLGYRRKKITISGKSHTVLEENPDEIPFLNMIYDKFLEGYSLSGLETYFRQNAIRSLNNNYLSSSQIHTILKSPHCVAATPEIYDYFSSKGCIMVTEREKFDGKHGLIVYGRTNGGKKKTHCNNPPEKWMVSIGLHKPIISADKWLAVQKRFGLNTFLKTRKYEIGILKGILRCKSGHLMQTKRKYDKEYNVVYEHYYCNKRMRFGKDYCDSTMVDLNEVDSSIINLLKDISFNKELLKKYMEKDIDDDLNIRNEKEIKKDIANTNKKITNLTSALQDAEGSVARKYIIKEIEQLEKVLLNLNSELREVEMLEYKNKNQMQDIDRIYNEICHIIKNYEQLTYKEINTLLSEIIKSCVWDNEKLKVIF